MFQYALRIPVLGFCTCGDRAFQSSDVVIDGDLLTFIENNPDLPYERYSHTHEGENHDYVEFLCDPNFIDMLNDESSIYYSLLTILFRKLMPSNVDEALSSTPYSSSYMHFYRRISSEALNAYIPFEDESSPLQFLVQNHIFSRLIDYLDCDSQINLKHTHPLFRFLFTIHIPHINPLIPLKPHQKGAIAFILARENQIPIPSRVSMPQVSPFGFSSLFSDRIYSHTSPVRPPTISSSSSIFCPNPLYLSIQVHQAVSSRSSSLVFPASPSALPPITISVLISDLNLKSNRTFLVGPPPAAFPPFVPPACGGALLDDPGLGKTFSSLALCATTRKQVIPVHPSCADGSPWILSADGCSHVHTDLLMRVIEPHPNNIEPQRHPVQPKTAQPKKRRQKRHFTMDDSSSNSGSESEEEEGFDFLSFSPAKRAKRQQPVAPGSQSRLPVCNSLFACPARDRDLQHFLHRHCLSRGLIKKSDALCQLACKHSGISDFINDLHNKNFFANQFNHTMPYLYQYELKYSKLFEKIHAHAHKNRKTGGGSIRSRSSAVKSKVYRDGGWGYICDEDLYKKWTSITQAHDDSYATEPLSNFAFQSVPMRRRLRLSHVSLIICPATLVSQWEFQASKHLRSSISVGVFKGTGKFGFRHLTYDGDISTDPANKLLEEFTINRDILTLYENYFCCHDIIIISDNTLQSEAKWAKKGLSPLVSLRFRRVIIDEGHKLGSSHTLHSEWRTRQADVLSNISTAALWVLTGTPTSGEDAKGFLWPLKMLLVSMQKMGQTAWADALMNPKIMRYLSRGDKQDAIDQESIEDRITPMDLGAGSRVFEQLAAMGTNFSNSLFSNLLRTFSLRTSRHSIEGIPDRFEREIPIKCGVKTANSYDFMAELVVRNMLLCDWFSFTHRSSFLHPSNSQMRFNEVMNLQRFATHPGSMESSFSRVHLVELMEMVAIYLSSSAASNKNASLQDSSQIVEIEDCEGDEQRRVDAPTTSSSLCRVSFASSVLVNFIPQKEYLAENKLDEKNDYYCPPILPSPVNEPIVFDEDLNEGRLSLGKVLGDYYGRTVCVFNEKAADYTPTFRIAETMTNISSSSSSSKIPFDLELAYSSLPNNKFIKNRFLSIYNRLVYNNKRSQGTEKNEGGGVNCEKCRLVSKAPVLIPGCCHLLCAWCVSMQFSGCALCGHPFTYDDKGAPAELIEIQMAYRPSPLVLEESFFFVRSEKIEKMVELLKRFWDKNYDEVENDIVIRPNRKVMIFSQFYETHFKAMSALESNFNFSAFDEKHRQGKRSMNERCPISLYRRLFGRDEEEAKLLAMSADLTLDLLDKEEEKKRTEIRITTSDESRKHRHSLKSCLKSSCRLFTPLTSEDPSEIHSVNHSLDAAGHPPTYSHKSMTNYEDRTQQHIASDNNNSLRFYVEHLTATASVVKNWNIQQFKENLSTSVLFCDMSASHGLDLSSTEMIILLDPVTNPADFEQLVSRAQRLGARRSVQIYTLYIESSIEDPHFQSFRPSFVHQRYDGKDFTRVETEAEAEARRERHSLPGFKGSGRLDSGIVGGTYTPPRRSSATSRNHSAAPKAKAKAKRRNSVPAEKELGTVVAAVAGGTLRSDAYRKKKVLHLGRLMRNEAVEDDV